MKRLFFIFFNFVILKRKHTKEEKSFKIKKEKGAYIMCALFYIFYLTKYNKGVILYKNKSIEEIKMKAVVTVIGKDSVGIIADVSLECAKHKANIIDITQSVLKDYFAMIMLVEIEKMETEFAIFQKELNLLGEKRGLDIRVMHEDIFNSMHRI